MNAGYTGSGYVNFPGHGRRADVQQCQRRRWRRAPAARALCAGRHGGAQRQLVVNGVASAGDLQADRGFTTLGGAGNPGHADGGTTNTIAFRSNGADLANIDEMTVR